MAKIEKEKKEKKGAGAPVNVGANGGTASETFSRAAQITVRGVVHRGLVGSVAHFFSTGAGMLTLTALVAGTSFFSLWDLNRQKEEGLAKRRTASMFNQESRTQTNAVQGGARSAANGDSLSYLASANPGGLTGATQVPSTQGGADASAQPALQPQVTSQPVDSVSKGAEAVGQAQATLGRGIGQMSSSLGGGNGLAGGGGMSGGVGRHFDSKTMVAQLPPSTKNGAASAMPATTTSGVSRSAIQGGGGKGSGGGAMSQLRAANGFSQAGKVAGSGEGQSYGAAQAFEGSHAIGGASADEQIGGTGDANGGAQTGGAGLDSGSPITKPTSGSPSPANSTTPSAGSGTDVTPWSGLVEIATALLVVAGGLLLTAGLMPPTMITLPHKVIMAKIAMVLAGIATIMGAVIIAEYGQMMQGGILTAVAALTTALAAVAAFSWYAGPPPAPPITTLPPPISVGIV